MKPAKERLVLSTLTPEQVKAITPKQFGESKEYFDWKNGVKDEDGNVIQKSIITIIIETSWDSPIFYIYLLIL